MCACVRACVYVCVCVLILNINTRTLLAGQNDMFLTTDSNQLNASSMVDCVI